MFCGNCGRAAAQDEVFCGGCGTRLVAAAPPPQHPAPPPPDRSPPAPPAATKGRTVAIVAVATIVVLAAVGIFAATRSENDEPPAAVSSSTTSTSGTEPPAAQGPDPQTVDVGTHLPPFHEELERLVAPRPEGRPALLVASSPRMDEPRPVAFTLLEWDRADYKMADRVDIDCGFREKLQIDEDQAVFLGCTGGASAHYGWALLPDRLKITVVPSGTQDDPQGGWLVVSFDTTPRPGAPDDITLLSKRCEPDCASGTIDTFSLVWEPTFRQWELAACTPEGQATRRYRGVNASVSHITFEGCPPTSTGD